MCEYKRNYKYVNRECWIVGKKNANLWPQNADFKPQNTPFLTQNIKLWVYDHQIQM